MLHDRLRRRNQAGFTLIELIIVIAIIGLLAGLGGPSLYRWMWKMRLSQATAGVERTLNSVRQIAMAENLRYCVTFTTDANYGNNGPAYQLGVNVTQETALASGTWQAVTISEIDGWMNDASTELYRGVSMEPTTAGSSPFFGTDGCSGLVYNNLGFLANPATDFTVDCNGASSTGASCIRMTLIQKFSGEQKTLWVDRGGGVRVSPGPFVEPYPPT